MIHDIPGERPGRERGTEIYIVTARGEALDQSCAPQAARAGER